MTKKQNLSQNGDANKGGIMEVNDLRIGNWIKYEDKLVQVVQLSSLMILCQRDENQFLVNCAPKVFQPIELTEEVLLKIGFVKKNDCYILTNECILFVYYKDSFKQELLASVKRKGKYYYNTNELKNYDIKYLHQLQNTYYLLTDQELEVEL